MPSNIIKPALSRGELRCVGAITSMSTGSTSKKKLARTPIPTGRGFQKRERFEEAVQILRGLRPKYEAYRRRSQAHRRGAGSSRSAFRSIYYWPFSARQGHRYHGRSGCAGAHQRYESFAGFERDGEKYRDDPRREGSSDQSQDYEKAAALRDCEQHTKDKLEEILNEWRERRDEREVIVTGDDIMQIVSKWTGVPLTGWSKKKRRNSSEWRRN